MKEPDIRKLLDALGCQRIKTGGSGWVSSSCPLAPWRHPSGKDDHPSFGVAIDNVHRSGFKCLSCHSNGTLSDLLYKIEWLGKKDLTEWRYFVQKNDEPSMLAMFRKSETKDSWNKQPAVVGGLPVLGAPDTVFHEDGKTVVDDTVPEAEISKFNSNFPKEVWSYLTAPKIKPDDLLFEDESPRGLDAETIKNWELKWNPDTKRIIIPIRDLTGRLVGLSNKAFYSWSKPKYLHHKGFIRDRYLYGENRVQKHKFGILVEGFFDVHRLHQFGYTNTVAMMGSYLSWLQLTKLTQFFDELIIFPDGDGPGREAAVRVQSQILPKIPKTKILTVPDTYDPDDFSKDDLYELLGPPIKNMLT